ncbi:L protein [Orgi virus]|uniref:Replicase n=1 Tax=Orgi virus TaxID=1911434 RepID=A0A2Z2CF58_9RHAB|nr:L protein [Orgi virus]AOX47517.1 L protein [Orgi virus]
MTNVDLFFEQNEGDLWSVDSEMDLQINPKKINFLSNYDYSLNSPLIIDELENLYNFLVGISYRPSWNLNKWKNFRDAIKKVNFKLSNLRKPDQFHRWLARFFLAFEPKLDFINKLLEKSQDDAEETGTLLVTFLRGWLGKVVVLEDKSNIPDDILKWGALYIDTHLITLAMNSVSVEEVKNLEASIYLQVIGDYADHIWTLRTKSFGKVLITQNFVLLLTYGVMLDRQTLLMVKDLAVARFQTMTSMINRMDERFNEEDWLKISALYRRGDEVMSHAGVQAYNLIKMVEPTCNKRLSDIAKERKELLPDFTNFDQHLEQSMNALSQTLPGTRDFLNLILHERSVPVLLNMYGSFRHWGHPYLDYQEGLRNLEAQVNMPKTIDEKYANALASDLAFMVLQKEFKEKKKWFVDIDQLDRKHPLYRHVRDKTWPTPKKIIDFGDNWHRLPLQKCMEIPDVIDPSVIYSDKSHSMQYSEVYRHILTRSHDPIPTNKVLESFLQKPATEWKKFLQEVNDNGLTLEDLIIGLKGKEREIKIGGRFYALLTWALREYFVITEHLIKTHFVPLFKGLTMADDMTTVIKKMMDTTSGQGSEGYENICIANHFDYSKWNNHQRAKANNPVFDVMGKFLGYPKLISRTHEFFEKSLIYYLDRPDQLRCHDGRIVNKPGQLYCWQGQLGGLEGLRQKGWSIVNLLAINRASKSNNTFVKVLAQGDNQVVCTNYRVQKYRNHEELVQSLERIWENNNKLIHHIEQGALKLGLIINRDETLQSAEYLVYGKVPVFRGNFQCLESKRWSRITCVTNDQLPTLANILSTVGSNALTVAHFSDSPLEPMAHYNFMGNFCRNLLELHNPAIKGPISRTTLGPNFNRSIEYKCLALYLDPSLGGISGTSLTRFLIRGFPDPVTESLAFWKLLYDHGPTWLKRLARAVGNPRLGSVTNLTFSRLLEDPLSLNIPGGINPLTLIKEEIKLELLGNLGRLRNNTVKLILGHVRSEEERFVSYLRGITPLFPRFLSEYMSATFLGAAKALIGLFQNSKTIRTAFTKLMDKKINNIIFRGEIMGLQHLDDYGARRTIVQHIWECSAKKADELRLLSWGSKIYGATIPHPVEMINNTTIPTPVCEGCNQDPPYNVYVSTLIPHGLRNYKHHRGPYQAYLGSNTSESTSILQPWEKESKIPMLKRAVRLRNAINWFVPPGSPVADSILSNLRGLTGEDWDRGSRGFKRTGSALHRFSCSRQLSGGYSAQNPARLTWICATTDTMKELGSQNYDFMYQALLLYAQLTACELHEGNRFQGFYHSHISCKLCLRTIEEINLTSQGSFQHADVSYLVRAMIPDGSEIISIKPVVDVPLGDWSSLSPTVQSYHVGRAEGFVFGELTLSGNRHCDDASLFPLGIKDKVIPRGYMNGLLDGLKRAGAVHCISKRSVADLNKPKAALLGVTLHLINQVMTNTALLNVIRTAGFENLFKSIPHKVPPSYPLSDLDLGSLGRNYMRWIYLKEKHDLYEDDPSYTPLWLFSDMNHYGIAGPYACSSRLIKLLNVTSLSKATKEQLRTAKDLVHTIKDPDADPSNLLKIHSKLYYVDHELRHACKFIVRDSVSRPIDLGQTTLRDWGIEIKFGINYSRVEYLAIQTDQDWENFTIQKRQIPLISGMRLFQFATGAHYKIRSILREMDIRVRDVVAGGDGSGGVGAAILRLHPNSSLIFNSLLDLSKVNLRGSSPSPPSAISEVESVRKRCINFDDSWQNPNDLANGDTWSYFIKIAKDHNLYINLVVLDMEVTDDSVSNRIERCLSHFIFQLGRSDVTLIYKSYLHRLVQDSNPLLYSVGPQFLHVYFVTTDISSSSTSEIYVIMSGRRLDCNFKLYPHLTAENLNLSWVTKSDESEFDRAIRLKKSPMFQGIPPRYQMNIQGDWIAFLGSLGIETGIAGLLGELIAERTVITAPVLPWIILIVGLNSLLGLSLGFNLPQAPPTDNEVLCTGVLVVGFQYWISVSFEKLSGYHGANLAINDYFPFSWKIIEEEVGGKKSKVLRKKKFRYVSFLGKYSTTKNLHLDSRMAAIGQFIRLLATTFQYPKFFPDSSVLDKAFETLGFKIRTKVIQDRTDLLQYFNKSQYVQIPGTLDIPEVVEQMDTEEAYLI